LRNQLLKIDIRGPLRRVLTLVPLLLALVGAWFAVSWFIGNTIAENVGDDDRGITNAQLALKMAGSDPLTHWTLAQLEQGTLPLDQIDQALAEYEQAVKLSPYDYRLWLAYGRALEQSGDSRKGEQAMRRAVELAPSYSYPRWYLGNLLLRNGHEPEAFGELRRASEADPQLRSQVFSLVWAVYGKNPTELSNAVGSSVATRAEFAGYLIGRKQFEEGLAIWRALAPPDKQANRTAGEGLIKTLIDSKQFRPALEIWNDLATSDAMRGKVGVILDGGFEHDLGGSNFGWQTKSSQQAQVAIDADLKHSGDHSLRLLFKARSNIELGLSQLVVVDPGQQYELELFLKTNKLESAGTPIVEIVDAVDGSVLAVSQPAPAGFNEWQRLALPFRTGAKTDGILIRVKRASCGEDNPTCPIFGTLWYDDFNLKRRS
jgi:tetratricopeptide (TPR) repeat protein